MVESENFYTNILGLKKIYGSLEKGFVGYRLENADILIEQEEPGEFESGRYLGFSLEVRDIASFYNDYSKKGIRFSGPPEKQFWGGVMTHIEDCNGNSFSVIQTNGNT